MPELPEVETVKNDVRQHVVGRRVERVDLRDPLLVRRPSPAEFVQGLEGQTLVEAERIAKVLLIKLSSGDYFAVQLMITGQLLLQRPEEPLAANARMVLDLDDGRQLRMNDENGYAKVQLIPGLSLARTLKIDELGPDPTAPEFGLHEFATRLRGRRGRIKSLLLDQRFLAGLGNIYVDEALFRAGIHPASRADKLRPAEIARLHDAIKEVLLTGIALRGTTIATFRDLFGRKGHFQEELRVFRRAGKPCVRCGTRVEVQQMGGRDTHFCPVCQPASDDREQAGAPAPRLL